MTNFNLKVKVRKAKNQQHTLDYFHNKKLDEFDNEKKNIEKYKTISVLIGPEGDFSPSERELILSNSNAVPFTISRNILRSDTAVISAISLVNFINNFH